MWDPKVREYCLKVWTASEIAEGSDRPVIIHYLSVIKPWHWGARHPLRNKWFAYLQMTPYKNYRPKLEKKYLQYRIKTIKNRILSLVIYVVKLVMPQKFINYVHKKRTT